MSLIIVSDEDVHKYHGDLVPVKAKLFANIDFRTSEDAFIAKGSEQSPDFAQEFAASMNGDNIRIASGTAYSTTDSLDFPNDAEYSLVVYDANDTKIKTVFRNLRIPPEVSPTTWGQIQIFSLGTRMKYAPRFMSDNAIFALFAGLVNMALKASNVIFGALRLDIAPISLADPVAVGTNSPLIGPAAVGSLGRVKLDTAPIDLNNPIAVGSNSAALTAAATTAFTGHTRLDTAPVSPTVPIAVGANNVVFLAVQQTKYLNSYGGVAAAIAAIGATPTELKVTGFSAVIGNHTFPATTKIVFEGEGVFSIASGSTLTVNRMNDPGNKQVFQQADATSNVRFGVGAVEKMNVAWFVGSAGLCTNAINQIIATITANGYGRLYFPEGIWTTAGNHQLPRNTIIEGAGFGFFHFGTTLRSTVAGVPQFEIGENIGNIEFRQISLDGNSLANTYGVLCKGSQPNVSGNFSFYGVQFVNFVSGFRVDSTDGIWQVSAIYFDSQCVFSNNSHSGIRANTVNSALNCDANFFIPVGGWAVWLEGSGAATFRGCEFAGTGTYGTHQTERQSINSVAGITVSGIAETVVTAAGMPGSPVTIQVPLTTTEHTTASLIAAAFRNALKNNPNVASFFHVVLDVNNDVTLFTLDAAANDATMNFTIASGTTTGITPNAVSVDVMAGDAPNLAAGVLHINGFHPPISFFGCQDEQLFSFLVNDAPLQDQIINFYGGLVQHPVRLNQSSRVNLYGCNVTAKAIRDGAGNSIVESYGCAVNGSIYNQAVFFPVEKRPTNFTSAAGGGIIAFESGGDGGNLRIRSQLPVVSYQNDIFFAYPTTNPWWQCLSTRPDQRLFRFGACNAVGDATFYYNLWRDSTTGRAKFDGNQSLQFKGYDFDADVRATQLSMSLTTALGTTGTVSMDGSLSNRWTITPTGNVTIDATNLIAGKKYYLTVLTSGTVDFTITFGTGFLGVPTLATGTVTAKRFVVEFYSPESSLIIQLARTAAL